MKTAANIQEALRNAKHVLAESDSAVNDITRIVNNFEGSEGKKRPFYIYCAATGIKKGMSQTPVFEKRLAKFGNILDLFAQYKSRDAVMVPVSTEPSAMDKLASIMAEAPVIEVAAEVITEPVIEVPEVVAIETPEIPVEAVIEVPEVVVGSEPEVVESPKAKKNRLRREAAAAKRAAENALA